MELTVRLKDILEERNINQKTLAEMTGLTTSVISEVATNRRISINREHITKIIEVLEIKDMNDIFVIK